MSKAVVFHAYGGPDVLTVIDTQPSRPGPGQVLVRVRAAGVQPFDALFRSGAARQWVPARFPQRLGNEFAGQVERLGPEVNGLTVGEEVLGWAMLACYAEHVIAEVDSVVAKPAGMPWSHAGVLSASGQTAASALRQLEVTAGETVLIHAAAGGVGSFAVQIARARGATVVGTASPRNHDYLRSLGAEPASYGDGLAERVRAIAPDGVDAVLDASGTVAALRTSLDLVADRGRIGTVAFQPAAGELGIRQLSTERSADQLAELARLYEAGSLTVSIQQTYPPEAAAEAHRVIEDGHVRGKLVIIP